MPDSANCIVEDTESTATLLSPFYFTEEIAANAREKAEVFF